MPIIPLPQFEADVKAALAEEDRLAYEALKAPRTLVVRFGSMKMIGEFPYSGTAKPGCGSKVVVRTFRGTEMGEMLTSTCPNSGCTKSVSRKDMLQYIQNSGGRDYPFSTDGRVLRIASGEDLTRQEALEQSRHGLKVVARSVAERLGVPVKVVDAEPVLGNETLTLFVTSEDRVETGELARELEREWRTRVEVRHVGARDEARLVADYEKCGQYCCCKNFLKVLKPVSMKSAKVQKATLDPLKISGRCGRLMCCLRYEDQTYEELKKKLPRRKSRVGTPEGDGLVVDAQILTQLVLVLLDEPGPDGKARQIAVPVEDLLPARVPGAPRPAGDDDEADAPPGPVAPPTGERPRPDRGPPRGSAERRPPDRPMPERPRPDRGPSDRGPPDRGPADRGGPDRRPPQGPRPDRGPRPDGGPPRSDSQAPPPPRGPEGGRPPGPGKRRRPGPPGPGGQGGPGPRDRGPDRPGQNGPGPNRPDGNRPDPNRPDPNLPDPNSRGPSPDA